jgi:GAF domain-containing protein
MAEDALLADLPPDAPATRLARHAAVARVIAALLDGEPDPIARMATVVGVLHQAFAPRYFWVGVYRVDPARPRELVIGPYQGTLGCLRIPFGRGVCGAVAASGAALRVPDVHAFPGHIACDSRSASEVVLPIFGQNGGLIGVLDIDSTEPDAFSADELAPLAALCAQLAPPPPLPS